MPERKSRNLGTVRRERLCIVMACDDAAEAARAGEMLSKVNNGILVTYRRADDILLNRPVGKVALVVLATPEEPAAIERTLKWMRHRWPHCPVTVIGSGGDCAMEMAARRGGASFLARPVSPQAWEAMIDHAFARQAGEYEPISEGLAAEEPTDDASQKLK